MKGWLVATALWACSCTSGFGDADAIALSGETVYWESNGLVMRAPVSGGHATTIASTNSLTGLFVDGVDVYWAECQIVAGVESCGNMSLFAIPVGGGAQVVLSDTVPGGYAFTSNGTTAFWYQAGTNGLDLVGAPVGGGSATTYGNRPNDGIGSYPLAADASNIYFESVLGTISRAGIAGGTPVPFANGFDVSFLAIDANNVYATTLDTSSTGSVLQLPLDGSAPTTLVANETLPGRVAVDASYVYWSSGVDCASSLKRIAIGGGDIETLATPIAPSAFAVSDDAIAWLESSSMCVPQAIHVQSP